MKGMPQTLLTRLAREAAAHAREGELTLQVCDNCDRVQYPYREVCAGCLGDALRWRAVDTVGRVLAVASVVASNEAWFREHAPWRIASVLLDAGPTVIVHLDAETAEQGAIVRVGQRFVDREQCVLFADQQDTAA